MEENKIIHMVVASYSFSSDVELKPFKTRKEAEEYIKNDLLEEKRIETEENGMSEDDMEIEYDSSSASLIFYPMNASGTMEKETMTWTIKEMYEDELIPE